MTDTAESLDPLRLPLIGERLIEASAGTGKTFTIAALYLRLLLGRRRCCWLNGRWTRRRYSPSTAFANGC